jgi:hypothetical protein
VISEKDEVWKTLDEQEPELKARMLSGPMEPVPAGSGKSRK